MIIILQFIGVYDELTDQAPLMPPLTAYPKVHNRTFGFLIIDFKPSMKFVLGTLAEADGGVGGLAGK